MKKMPLSKAEKDQLTRLAALPDAAIDTADIPEAPAENWVYARRGEFYRPRKQTVTMRLDADVVAWFKDQSPGRGYQTEINRVLRQHVAERAKR
jgi:uncharacterized protein (DUF4415 family)